MCHMSHIMCYVSHVTCHLLRVTCLLSLTPTASDPLPANTSHMHSRLVCKEQKVKLISRPGRSQGLLYKQPRHSVSHPFPPTALRRRHAQTVRDSTSSYSDQELS